MERMTGSDDWQGACREAGTDAAFSLFRQRGFEEILPWDFIDTTIPKEKLWEEYRKALSLAS
ncbi:MAG TPA: hypothetical protein VMH06_05890 [Thermodesulfovibrionales bacterium]|nr:hypothetical protein [Thermodesulfovibrionales bacterium]